MEWISVNNRLPEGGKRETIHCLVFCTYWGIVVRPFDIYHNCWNTEDDDDHYTEATGGRITHWMPLPEPPTE